MQVRLVLAATVALFLMKVVSVRSDTLDSASVAQTNFTAADYAKIKSTPALPTAWFFLYPLTYFYVSMASEHVYRSYYEIMVGRPAQSEDDLINMNLRIKFTLALPSYKADTRADSVDYDQTQMVEHVFKQNCTPQLHLLPLDLTLSGLSKAMCTPSLFGNSAGVRTDLIPTSYDKIVWESSEERAVLITRFVNNAIVDWKVLSYDPILTEKAKTEIFDVVESLGLIL